MLVTNRQAWQRVMWGACLTLFGLTAVGAQKTEKAEEEQAAPALAILGAADGQVKLLAETARVNTSLTIESISAEPVTALVRVGPFRDASGRLHAVTATTDSAAAAGKTDAGKPSATTDKPPAIADKPVATTDKPPADAAKPPPAAAKASGAADKPPSDVDKPPAPAPPPAPASVPGSLTITLPAHGAARLQIEATLQTEGEYTSDIAIVSGKRRDVVRLVVTRALRDLAVDIQGVDAAHGIATVGWASSGELRLVLLEKIGRDVKLDPLQITKLTRKAPESGRAQAPYHLTIGGADPQPVTLAPNQSRPLTLTVGGLDGAGEYAGTLRIGTPGSKPVDQDFTLTLRESRSSAFGFILAGVLLAAFLRWLSQTLRPKLVETRRAHLLVRELDELIAEPARDAEERDVLRLLRREVVAAQLSIDAESVEKAKTALDRLEARRPLAVEWMRRRRQVEALRPDTLRDRFRPTVAEARDTLVHEGATTEQIAESRKKLAGLDTAIDTALREELTARIKSLRENLDTLVATRPSSQLAIVAPATLRPLLDEADAEAKANNLRGALAIYDRAQRAWTSFLLDDLAVVVSGPAPSVVPAAEWAALVKRLDTALIDARDRLDKDPDGAIRRYHGAWADYVATVSASLRRAFDELGQKVQDDANFDDDEKAVIVAVIEKGVKTNGEARAAIAAGKTQEAVGLLSIAIEQHANALRSATPRTRASLSNVSDAADAVGPIAADLPFSLNDGRGDEFIGTEMALTSTTDAIDGIDLFVILVAVVVATLLGLTVLWTPNATWGGWDDRVVAVLWGLGFHQFTFTGLAGVTDRLRGSSQTAGG